MSSRCEEVRNQFSALWENELDPSGETEVKRHLKDCPECQREFARFETTLRMLHSVGEVRVPGGFLSGVCDKIEGRKRQDLFSIRALWTWPHVPLRLKLPIQGLAMVAIVFLALYLTKMMPGDSTSMKGQGKPLSSLLEVKKDEGESKPPTAQEKGLDQRSLDRQTEKRNVPERLKEKEVPLPREAEAPQASILLKKKETEEVAKVQQAIPPGPEPSQEFVLKVTDPKKTVSHLQELVRQLGGETVSEEGNSLLISLPNPSIERFHEELEKVGSPTGTPQRETSRRATAGALAASGEKKGEPTEKNEEAKGLEVQKEGRTLIRIVFVEE